MFINQMTWVASGLSCLVIAGSQWLGATQLVAGKFTASKSSPAATAVTTKNNPIALRPTHQPFWHCSGNDGVATNSPTASNVAMFPVWMKGCPVAQLADQRQAHQLTQRLQQLLDDPATAWEKLEIKAVGAQVQVHLGPQLLLNVAPEIGQALNRHPETLAIDWSNQIRQLAGVEPLTLAQAQQQIHGLHQTPQMESGTASWYGPYFHGRQTANGEIYNQYALTAAHRTLPLGTFVRVTNQANGKSIVVRVNDRGPYYDEDSRIIDLSYRAAQVLGGEHKGIIPIQLMVLTQQPKPLRPMVDQAVAFLPE
jgi:rare lipoprotein A (peptidoglycan hydrolase)